MSAPTRRVRTAHLMGTVVSVHVVGDLPEVRVDAAIDAFVTGLEEIERVFSTFIDDSDISRLRRGEAGLDEIDPRVRDVLAACREVEKATGGRFSAQWRGAPDPTGYVKGWAVDTAGEEFLAPLLRERGGVAVGVNAGGDLRLWTAADQTWAWRVGIADPTASGSVLATLDVRNGAVATSGTAERGAHIIDPRTGLPATSVRSATVVADTLTTADVWATAGVVAGFDDLTWIADAPARSGIVVAADGRIRRWVGGVEVQREAAGVDALTAVAGPVGFPSAA